MWWLMSKFNQQQEQNKKIKSFVLCLTKFQDLLIESWSVQQILYEEIFIFQMSVAKDEDHIAKKKVLLII